MARKATTRAKAGRPAEGDQVGRAIQQAINSAEIIATGVVNLVRDTLVIALSGVRDVGAEIGSAAVAAVRGSIRAVQEIGGDLGGVAKQAIKGTVQAAEEIGGDLGGVARSASRGAVKAANEVGGDVAAVARKAVEGTIEAAHEIGADVGHLATNAAEGAIEAADRIGSAAGRAVRKTLSGTIAGTKVVIQEALEGSPVSTRSGGERPAPARAAGRAAPRPRRRKPETP